MNIIEIKTLDNGAHRNQRGGVSSCPDGWAIIPSDMACENFPFGEVETAEIDGVVTVTKWTPRILPSPEEEIATQLDIIEAQTTYTAMMTDTLLEGSS